jgi:predicted nucleic acid-binding protein
MLVVADASPLIALVQMSQLDILPSIFEEVLIPPAVLIELQAPNRPDYIRDMANSLPPWLIVRAPSNIQMIQGLHPGETAAICLAQEIKSDFLLIDELKCRKQAIKRNLSIIGTIGVLELAAYQGRLDLGDAFECLKKTDFWVSKELLDERLAHHLRHKKK